MAMPWAQRLKRVFGIDIETGQARGGAMKIIAGIRLHGCRRYESMEGRGRTKQEPESRATQEAKAEKIPASSARFSTTWTGSRPTHYPNPEHPLRLACSTPPDRTACSTPMPVTIPAGCRLV